MSDHHPDPMAEEAIRQSERQRELTEALAARHGDSTAFVVRRCGELIWLLNEMVPPIGILNDLSPHAVHSRMLEVQELALREILSIFHTFAHLSNPKLTCADIAGTLSDEMEMVLKACAEAAGAILSKQTGPDYGHEDEGG